MKLYFASNNPHKKEELTGFFKPDELLLLSEEGKEFYHDETGASFVENALGKALTLFRQTGSPALADDSGLCVEALSGGPGIYTARYGDEPGKILTSRQRYEYLLQNLKDHENRKACFVCALVLVLDENRYYLVQESWGGTIAREAHGTYGFGYDPVFVPEGFDITAAQLDSSVKEKISHRGKAAIMMQSIWNTIRKEYVSGK